jgi:hypothetical protein
MVVQKSDVACGVTSSGVTFSHRITPFCNPLLKLLHSYTFPLSSVCTEVAQCSSGNITHWICWCCG